MFLMFFSISDLALAAGPLLRLSSRRWYYSCGGLRYSLRY